MDISIQLPFSRAANACPLFVVNIIIRIVILLYLGENSRFLITFAACLDNKHHTVATYFVYIYCCYDDDTMLLALSIRRERADRSSVSDAKIHIGRSANETALFVDVVYHHTTLQKFSVLSEFCPKE